MKALLPIYVKFQTRIHEMVKDQKGATMVEYALMLALIAAVCVGVVQTIGTDALNTFNTIDGAVAGAGG